MTAGTNSFISNTKTTNAENTTNRANLISGTIVSTTHTTIAVATTITLIVTRQRRSSTTSTTSPCMVRPEGTDLHGDMST